MLLGIIVVGLVLGSSGSAAPLVDSTWNLAVEGTAPGSGEVYDTDASQSLPGFNHMLRNQSALPAPESGANIDFDEEDPSLGVTLEGVCKHMILAGDGKIGETTLEGECADEYGYWWITTLNLNECAANVDGQLTYREG